MPVLLSVARAYRRPSADGSQQGLALQAIEPAPLAHAPAPSDRGAAKNTRLTAADASLA